MSLAPTPAETDLMALAADDTANATASVLPQRRTNAQRVKTAVALLLKIGISGGLLALAMQRVDLNELAHSMRGFDFRYLGVIFAIFAVHIGLSGVRWQSITEIYARRADLRWFTVNSAIAYFFNQIMLGTVGGDTFRVISMIQRGYLFGQAVSVILIERVAILFSMLLLALATLPFFMMATNDQIYAILFGLGSVSVVVGIALAGSLASHAFWIKIIPWHRPRAILEQLARSFLRSLRLTTVNLCTLTILLSGILIYWLAARGLGFQSSLLLYLVVAPIPMLIAMLPITIGGWGAREIAFGMSLSILGGSYTEGVIVAAAVGVLMMGVGLPGAIAFIFQKYLSR